MTRLKVVIAEDKRTIANEIRDCLETEPDILVVGMAQNGKEAVEIVSETNPDVVLMDLDMPVMNGIEAIHLIKHELPLVQIVVLTVLEDGASLFEALQAGARGYLLKRATPDEIADAVRSVANGGSAIPPSQVQTMCQFFDRISRRSPALLRLFDQLTRSELDTLRCIGEGKTNPQIAQELCKEEQSIKNSVTSIYKKLHVNSRVEAAVIANEGGLA